MAVALHPAYIPVHIAAETAVGQPKIDHKELLQQLKKMVERRRATRMGPSPPLNDSKLYQTIFLRHESYD